MDINNLLCNDETKNDNDVEMKDANIQSSSIDKKLPELQSQGSNYESTNPLLYSTAAAANVMANVNNDEMPNMNSLTINSPTSQPITSTSSKLDSISGIAAFTVAALRQRKHVRGSPRARKPVLSVGSGSPGNNHYPYRYNPVTPQPPPNHPISVALLRRNRIHNGIKNVVRGVSDTLFTHNNNTQEQNNSNPCRITHNIFSNINNLCSSRNSQPSSSSSSAPPNTQNQQDQQSTPDPNLNQDDVNHGIRYCVQWIKYAISHLDQEINLLRNIANESFHVYCNNVHNRRNANTETTDNNNENSSNQDLESSTSSIEYSNNHNNYTAIGSNQINNFPRKSLFEIKRDIILTIRRTIEIIIKGASKYLPNESRQIIRQFILSLPSRIDRLTQKIKAPKCITSTCSNATTSVPNNSSNGKMMDTDDIDDIDGIDGIDGNVSTSQMSSSITEPLNNPEDKENSLNSIQSNKEESLKIMTLATEGNDILKKMMDVFEKSFQENNRNNLDNVNLINTNESSSLNYNANKMLYNPISQNNNKYNKINSNSMPNFDNTNNSTTTTTTTNNNFIIDNSMNYEDSNQSNNN